MKTQFKIVSMRSLEGSSLGGETLRKTAMGRESGQSVVGKRKSAFERGPR